MPCDRLMSIDFDDTMANNFSQAFFFFSNRKTFLIEETTSLRVTFVFLGHISVLLSVLTILCVVSALS